MSYELSSDVGSESYFSKMESLGNSLAVRSAYRSGGLESTALGYEGGAGEGGARFYGINVEGAIH